MKLALTSWRSWTRAQQILTIVAVLGVIGTIVASTLAATYYAGWAGAVRQAATAQEDLASVSDERDTARTQLATAQTKIRQYESQRAELSDRETAVIEREKAVEVTETQIAASSFGGGVRLVGTNTTAGIYTTGEITSGMCYYVWKTSTASDAGIVDNNIVESGTATVTLNDGDIFESRGCGKWTKSG